MQEVNFASFPGVKPFEHLPKLGLVLNHIKKEKPSKKDLKRFFREHDLYDAESFEIFLKIFDIDTKDEKSLKLGPFLTELATIIDPEDRKRLLFKFLTNKNEILMKYVMDGLAEHLHSTNELYRYITSYVYPGTYITLVNFKHWITWLEASEHIKMVGIRWGLSDLGKEGIDTIIKLIDIDDILDASDEDDDDDMDDDVDDADEEDRDENEDELPSASSDDEIEDSTEEPENETQAITASNEALSTHNLPQTPVAKSQSNTTQKQFSDQDNTSNLIQDNYSNVQVVVQPIAPKHDETPLQLVREAFAAADAEEEENDDGEFDSAPKIRIEQFRLDESLIAENLRAIHVWWRQRPGGKLLSASNYGFEKSLFEEDLGFALFKLSCLAVQLFRYQGRLQVAKGGQSFAILDQMGLFTNLYKSKKSVDSIMEALLKAGLAQHVDYFSNLHIFLILRKNLKELKNDGINAILKKENIADILSDLWEQLGAFSLHYEILWICRELTSLGLIEAEDAKSIGVVPLPKVRETAFRLGFIETPYAADFPHLVSISRKLSLLFNEDDAWEAPLAYFEAKRDLRYDSSEPAYFTRDQLGID